MATQENRYYEFLGWFGMLALIGAYCFVSFGFLDPQGFAYQIVNIVGGVSLVMFALVKKATQLALLNAFWALIGIVAIINSLI